MTTRLPRRRRPGVVALAVALVAAGILASTAVYSVTDRRLQVLLVEATVPAGAVIHAGDLGTAKVSVGSRVQVIPATRLDQVLGHVAGTALHRGMLLTPAELATERSPGPGQALVPLPVRPSALPANGLRAGDHVLVCATPGIHKQAGSGNSASAPSPPLSGVVAAVSLANHSDGFDVVDVIVWAKSGPDLAALASTGQFALIVTRRGPS